MSKIKQKLFKEMLVKIDKEIADLEKIEKFVKECTDLTNERAQKELYEVLEILDLYLTTSRNMRYKYGGS